MQRAQRIRGATGFCPDAADFLRPEEDVAGAIDQNAHAELVGTSIGPALAISTQENPPAAAASAKLADIFKASRRLKSDMVISRSNGVTSERAAAANDATNNKTDRS